MRFYSARVKTTLFFQDDDSSAPLDLPHLPLLERPLLSFTLKNTVEGFHFPEHLIKAQL